MKVLHLDKNHELLINEFKKFGFENDEDYQSSKAEIEEKIHEYDGIVIRSRFKIDKDFLDKAINLKFIGRVGAGLENIDCDYAESKNIKLISAPEGNRNAVGEHTLGMILSLFNKLNKGDKEIRNGLWQREQNRGWELDGKIVGIIGYGNMGKAFAKKLRGFDVEVICHDIKPNVGDGNCKQVTLEELQKRADILSLHTPETPLTINMVNTDFINKFEKSFWLINTARGKSVVTEDLVSALKSKKILGAGLDVLEYEKSSFENFFSGTLPDAFRYLITSENVILSPHVAGWTIESKEKLAQTIVDKVNKHFVNPTSETNLLEGKVNEFADTAKDKINEALNSETAKNIKDKANEFIDKAEETIETASEKIKEFANSDEVKKGIQKSKDFLNDLFKTKSKE